MEQDERIILEFADVAERYCNLIEHIDQLGNNLIVIQKCSEILAELYLKAQRLPVVEAVFDNSGEKLDDETYIDRATRVARVFGPKNDYWVTLYPFYEEEVGKGSLTEDLLDIYRDIKENMILFKKNTPEDKMAAVWYWKFSFMSHWGFHTTDALRMIHWIMFE